MSHPPSLRGRLARTVAVTAVLGLAATTASFVVVRGDVDRFNQKCVDRPATDAVSSVQTLNLNVDQVIATANGVVATSRVVDPQRFVAVLRHDVLANPSL